jgi:hypothetical protein
LHHHFHRVPNPIGGGMSTHSLEDIHSTCYDRNPFSQPLLRRQDSSERRAGSRKHGDTIAVFAFVGDSDNDKRQAGTFPADPTMKVESSEGTGNFHYWYVFEEAIDADTANSAQRNGGASFRVDAVRFRIGLSRISRSSVDSLC